MRKRKKEKDNDVFFLSTYRIIYQDISKFRANMKIF